MIHVQWIRQMASFVRDASAPYVLQALRLFHAFRLPERLPHAKCLDLKGLFRDRFLECLSPE